MSSDIPPDRPTSPQSEEFRRHLAETRRISAEYFALRREDRLKLEAYYLAELEERARRRWRWW